MPRKTRRFPRISREVGMGDGKEKGDCVMQSPGNIASPPKTGARVTLGLESDDTKNPTKMTGFFDRLKPRMSGGFKTTPVAHKE